MLKVPFRAVPAPWSPAGPCRRVFRKGAVESMSVFAKHLRELKAICSFFRSSDNRQTFLNKIPRDNPDMLLSRLTLAHVPPSFAKWRWNTLHDCENFITNIRPAARLWRRSMYGDVHDEAMITIVASAFGRAEFWLEVAVHDVASLK
jgi:hypothetical protein